MKVNKQTGINFDMLLEGRAELIAYNGLNGHGLIKDKALKGIRIPDPPLEAPEMFLCLHMSQEALGPKLTEALRSIKRDGTYDRLQKTVLNPHLP